jgi:hypothetical protein
MPKMPPIDVEALVGQGALEATVRGRVTNARREGRAADVIEEVATPICQIVDVWMRDPAKVADADRLMADAYHAGVTPTQLALGMEPVWKGKPPKPTPAPIVRNPDVPVHK